MSDDYDKIPVPKQRCENCSNGTMHVTNSGDKWPDVYRCALDDGLKDYRVHCHNYRSREVISPMTNPLTREDVEELRALLAKATPGPWAEYELWNNNSGTRYRDSQIIASNPLHPSHMDRTITVCDTLNAWHCFSEEDREANMKLICALYNAAPALLALASQSLSREAEIRREVRAKTLEEVANEIEGGYFASRLFMARYFRALAQQPDKEPK